MLGLKLREEFAGKRLSGTTIDFKNRRGTGALDRSATDFLNITYPSTDLLKTIEAVQPGQSRPVVIIGSRGLGKSHLMAAISQMLRDPEAGETWCHEWATSIQNDLLTKISFRSEMEVIAESMEMQNYKFLWDLLFDNHPNGTYIRGKWDAQGDKKTEVPGYDLIMELVTEKPTVLILDEFQTWYEGLTNTKQYPWRTWAFNFIQILSQIAESNPDLLSLVISVRDGSSDAAQQVYRVNPVRIDFKGPQAKKDRQRLLLYRIFENRLNIADADIDSLIKVHFDEYLRLYHIPGSEHEKHKADFLESWPYSPLLIQLLDDQVLIATDTQETRDLIRILVDVFKTAGDDNIVISPADFSINNEKSGVAALLDSVANQLHRDLRTKALRNLEAVSDAIAGTSQSSPNLEGILSALWLRSLSLENTAGAEAHQLQIDISKDKVVDDNLFQAELALIEENSFNIHRKGSRLVFLNEENPQAKLMAHAKNDRLFENGADIDHLADEIRYVLAGVEGGAQGFRVIVLKREWEKDPWSEIEDKDQPQNWDNRVPVVVVPTDSVKDGELGQWLKNFVSKHRNIVRFLLPKAGSGNTFYDKSLLVTARAVHLADQWKRADSAYGALHVKYQKLLRDQLRGRFDRFGILETWNFGVPEKCTFLTGSHGAEGGNILGAIQDHVRRELFIPEEADNLIIEASKVTRSVADVLEQLKEPTSGGEASIPWIGETDIKEHITRVCAQGKITLNILGRDMLERRAGETEDDAWQRMKGRLGNGRQLEETTIHEPGASISSGGSTPEPATPTDPTNPDTPTGGGATPPPGPGGLFGGGSSGPRESLHSEATSSLSLLGKLESWNITAGSQVHEVKININQLTGAQLEKLIKGLPDGITYGLNLEKE
ncbi:MAG: DUF499 domain-containing protein [Gammaproteobacteria bacterium]